MKVLRRRARTPLPIIGMADIAFLLLVFIMLLSLMSYRPQPSVDYPEAKSVESGDGGSALRILADREGTLYLDGVPGSLEEIEGALAQRIATDPSLKVELVADGESPYRHVHSLLRLLQRLEHSAVTLAARPAAEDRE
ncbi:MAG: ExbD/TolR family protein [Spirochaetaceae bacterium]